MLFFEEPANTIEGLLGNYLIGNISVGRCGCQVLRTLVIRLESSGFITLFIFEI